MAPTNLPRRTRNVQRTPSSAVLTATQTSTISPDRHLAVMPSTQHHKLRSPERCGRRQHRCSPTTPSPSHQHVHQQLHGLPNTGTATPRCHRRRRRTNASPRPTYPRASTSPNAQEVEGHRRSSKHTCHTGTPVRMTSKPGSSNRKRPTVRRQLWTARGNQAWRNCLTLSSQTKVSTLVIVNQTVA